MCLVAPALDRSDLEKRESPSVPAFPARVDIHSDWTGLGSLPVTVVRGMDCANWLKLGMTVVGRIMPPQRCPHPNSWNL